MVWHGLGQIVSTIAPGWVAVASGLVEADLSSAAQPDRARIRTLSNSFFIITLPFG
jgi:hypothetical protein